MQNKNKIDYDVIIIGAGVAGLNAAVEAQAKGLSVLVLEARLEDERAYAVRPQQVVLTRGRVSMDIVHKINSYKTQKDSSDNEKYLHRAKQFKGGGVIAIKTIQRVLKNQFDVQKKILNKQKHEIHFGRTPTNIDLKEGKITVGDSKDKNEDNEKKNKNKNNNFKTYTFQYLIGADGKNRKSMTLINKKDIKTTGISHPHNQHVNAYITIKEKNGSSLPVPNVQSVFGLTNKSYKYFLLFKPRLNPDGELIKCSFSGELPFHVNSKAKDKDKVEEYIEKVVKYHYEISGLAPKAQIEVEFVSGTKKHTETNKDNLSYSLLSLDEIKRTDKAVYSSNNHHYLPIGDAKHDSMYQVGHGAQDAMEDGYALATYIFSEKQPDFPSYSKDVIDRRTRSRWNLAKMYVATPTSTPISYIYGRSNLANSIGLIVNKFYDVRPLSFHTINDRVVENKLKNTVAIRTDKNNQGHPIPDHELNESYDYRQYKTYSGDKIDQEHINDIRKDVHEKLEKACEEYLRSQKTNSIVKSLGYSIASAAAFVGAGLAVLFFIQGKSNYKKTKMVGSTIGGFSLATYLGRQGYKNYHDIKAANDLIEQIKNGIENDTLMDILYTAMRNSPDNKDSLAMHILREFDRTGNESENIKTWPKNKSGSMSARKQSFMTLIPSLRSLSTQVKMPKENKFANKKNGTNNTEKKSSLLSKTNEINKINISNSQSNFHNTKSSNNKTLSKNDKVISINSNDKNNLLNNSEEHEKNSNTTAISRIE